MSRTRRDDPWSRKAVAGLFGESGIPAWQRVAAYAFVLGFIAFWVLVTLIFHIDKNAMQDRYEGLPDCTETVTSHCIKYVDGEMTVSRSSSHRGNTSEWRPVGAKFGHTVYVPLHKISDKAEGMFVDHEFVGVQDAETGERWPAMGDANTPVLWYATIGCLFAALFAGPSIHWWGRFPDGYTRTD